MNDPRVRSEADAEVLAFLRSLKLGPCKFCGAEVTEADPWGHEGELDAYPPKATPVYHCCCRFDAAARKQGP